MKTEESWGKNKDEGSIYKEHQCPAASQKPVGETEMSNHYRISQNFFHSQAFQI